MDGHPLEGRLKFVSMAGNLFHGRISLSWPEMWELERASVWVGEGSEAGSETPAWEHLRASNASNANAGW